MVTSNISSMPEVGGEPAPTCPEAQTQKKLSGVPLNNNQQIGGACYVDPYDVASIRKGIERVIHDASFREELIQKGLENVRRFEPGVIAEQYLEVYKLVGGDS